MSKNFVFKFDGYQTSSHNINMGQLGHSLIGLEKIINTGLIVLSQNRLPKRGEKFPLQIMAGEPKKGSVEIIGALGELSSVAWTLPLVAEVFHTAAGELIWRWVSARLC